MKAIKFFSKLFLFLVLTNLVLSSCNYLEKEENERVVQNRVEQNPYVNYSNATRKGYYCNNILENDKLIENSYQVNNDGSYSINLDGRWKVVRAVLYGKDGSEVSRNEISSGRGFLRNEPHNTFNINQTIFNINKGKFFNENYPSEVYDIICRGNYNNTKFGEMVIDAKSRSDEAFIVDINQNVTQMVIQITNLIDDVSFQTSYIRYVLQKQ